MPVVYIVDDDREIAKAIQLLFRLLHYKSEAFHHPRDLARHLLAAAALPDLLVVDMSMPEVNGMDVVRWIRGSHRFKNLPMLALSSETHPVLVDDAIRAGANAYLFKPITLEELESCVSGILRQASRQPGHNQ